MNEPKYTSGPWTWWTSNSYRRLKHDDRGKTTNVLEAYVCRDGCMDILVSEEDMALIAAAPDLLEALINARKHLEDYEEHFSGEKYNNTQINAAIAKALGRP